MFCIMLVVCQEHFSEGAVTKHLGVIIDMVILLQFFGTLFLFWLKSISSIINRVWLVFRFRFYTTHFLNVLLNFLKNIILVFIYWIY